jgi:hypothetical protein
MTALALSLTMVAGLFSGCNRSHVRTERVEEQPYGESYVKETPEQKQQHKGTQYEEGKKSAGEVEQSVKKTSQDINELKVKGEKAAQNLPFGKKGETYSKETNTETTKTKHSGRS